MSKLTNSRINLGRCLASSIVLVLTALSAFAAEPDKAYSGLQGIRLADTSTRARMVLDADSIGGWKVHFDDQNSRIVLALSQLSRLQALTQLRPWLTELSTQPWMLSVRTSWAADAKEFTAIFNVLGIEKVRAFVLANENISPRQRLVLDFEYRPEIADKKQPPRQIVVAQSTAAKLDQSAEAGIKLDSLVGKLMRSNEPKMQSATPEHKLARNQSQRPDRRGGRSLVIVIDAGHGGKDPGALGNKHHHEKFHTLLYAKELAKAINRRAGMRAVLTRKDDKYISLSERVRIATRSRADLFISLHADSFHDKKARGSSVYALSLTGATSKTAQLMADNANSTLGFGELQIAHHDPMVAATLVDLAQTASIEKSLDFGKVLLSKIGNFQTLHSNKVQQANFFVLRTAEYPAVLVELAFISNPQEEKKLSSFSFRKNVIRSIIGSIDDFFRLNPPTGSYFALQ